MRKREQKKAKAACSNNMIGGQALMEGILMRAPRRQAIVVRTEAGLVEQEKELTPLAERFPILGLPFLRGIIVFFESNVTGIRALLYSADLVAESPGPDGGKAQEEEPTRFDRWVEKRLGVEGAKKLFFGLAVAIALCFTVGLFILLPTVIGGLAAPFVDSNLIRNLIEGVIRIGIFLGYLYLTARVPDMRRVFSYHGAEHKTIACHERGLPLTVDCVREMPRQHPRCGTSFLFVVMIITILLFSLFQWSNVWTRLGLRLLLFPLVVAVSYEINRWAGRHNNRLTRILTAPGLWLQNVTTNEPDDGMIQVAIRALTLVLPREEEAAAELK